MNAWHRTQATLLLSWRERQAGYEIGCWATRLGGAGTRGSAADVPGSNLIAFFALGEPHVGLGLDSEGGGGQSADSVQQGCRSFKKSLGYAPQPESST